MKHKKLLQMLLLLMPWLLVKNRPLLRIISGKFIPNLSHHICRPLMNLWGEQQQRSNHDEDSQKAASNSFIYKLGINKLKQFCDGLLKVSPLSAKWNYWDTSLVSFLYDGLMAKEVQAEECYHPPGHSLISSVCRPFFDRLLLDVMSKLLR